MFFPKKKIVYSNLKNNGFPLTLTTSRALTRTSTNRDLFTKTKALPKDMQFGTNLTLIKFQNNFLSKNA